MAAILALILLLAVPNYIRNRQTVQRNVCVEQLSQIDAAKTAWARAEGKPLGVSVPTADLAKHLKKGLIPKCPAGGAYTLNPVGTPATCSLSETLGHTR